MIRRFFRAAAFSLVSALLFSACTSMHVTMAVQRPPNMDTSGIRRIAIMPFEPASDTPLQNEIARSITATATTRIIETRQFTLVDPSEIQRLQRSGESIENHVDALFAGEIVTLNVRDSQRQVPRYNPATRSNIMVTLYEREVELAFSYRFIRARDGSLIDIVTKRAVNRDSNDNPGGLRSASSLAQAIVVNRLSTLHQDVAPHTVNERRTLMQDKSDRNIRASMENAFALVRAGNYRGGMNIYMQTYEHYRNFPALYNAAILNEILGETHTAIALFQANFAETGNPAARAEIDRLNRVLEDQGMIAAVYSDTQTQRDRAVAHANREILGNLPPGSRVWVYNNSGAEIALSNAVIADISSALMRAGVSLVDRDSARLRAAEMELQMRGNVRDEDIVSIGNSAGASIIVEVSIEGVGYMRRLQIRIIDIERGVPIMISDTSESWQI